MFKRIAVVNRCEPAVRLIQAVRGLNAEKDFGIQVSALHTAAEAGALFVRLSDEAVLIRDAGTAGNPCLDRAELERALLAGRADAAWVGWGFVAKTRCSRSWARGSASPSSARRRRPCAGSVTRCGPSWQPRRRTRSPTA